MMCANVTRMTFGITNRQSRPGLSDEELRWAREQDWLETKHRFETDPWYRGVVFGHMAQRVETMAYSMRRAGESAQRAAEQMREALRVMQ